MIGVFEKPINTDVPLTTILFFQSAICLLCIAPETIKNYRQLFRIQHQGIYVVRILSGMACYGILFYLIRSIPIAEAFIYQYSASLWMPFIMLLWLNVRMQKSLWWGILVGFAGILLMLKPSPAMFGIISLVGILCGIMQGISVVALRKLTVTEPVFRILFYYFLVGTLVTSFFLIKYWKPLTLKDLIFLLAVGLSTYLAQKFITISLRYAHATTLAPITYVSILFSGFFGWLIWHEVPEKITLLGMVLVISGCLLTLLFNQKASKISIEEDRENESAAFPRADNQATE
jgi:drug/metabolite transporter (DMT)-like permease